MHPKHWLLTGLAILATFLVFALTQAQAPQDEQCPLDTFLALPQHQQQACIEAMGGKPSFVATVEAAGRATAQALFPPGAGVEPLPAPIHTPRPPGYIPDIYRAVKPLDTAGPNRTAPSRFRYGQSVWQVGPVLTSEGNATPFIVATDPFQCALQALVLSYTDEEFPDAKVGHQWNCPENVGQLTITGATGPTGIITFTDTFSRTITFDLTREAWRLEGEPWAAGAVPPAGSIPADWEIIAPHRPPPDGTDLKIPQLPYERSLGAWWIGATLTPEGWPQRIVAVSYENYGCEFETIRLGCVDI